MQVTELESKGLKKSFKIVVGAAQINEQMETELKAAGERVKIPGFRPGFIPMKILQQRYGKSLQPDVLKAVINHASSDVIAKKKLKPAMTPQINIEDYKEGGDLAFTMSFESFPDMPEIAFDQITLERKTFEIEEKEIDESAARVAEHNPKFAPAAEGSKARSGNAVLIDFKGMVDGKAFDGGSAEDFRLELGSGQFIEGFEEQLIGTRKGDDKIVNVTFPKDYPAQNLAGQEASFAVKVKDILIKETPEVNDEFTKTLGFADVRAFREAIRDRLMKEYDQVVRNQLKKQLFDTLEEKAEFEAPQSMVEMEFNTIWERLQEAKKRGDDIMADKDEEELKKEYQRIAQRRVKLGLLLADVGSRHKLQITREELGRAVMQQAGNYPGQEQQVMEFYRKHPERADDLRGPILEEKAVDFILSKVTFDDTKVSVDELVEESEEDGDSKKKAAKSSKAKADKPEKEAAAKPKKKKAAGE